MLLATCYLLLITYYLLLATYYLLPAAYYLVLGTYYLLLGTYYLVLGTWYLVLATWYLLLATYANHSLRALTGIIGEAVSDKSAQLGRPSTPIPIQSTLEGCGEVFGDMTGNAFGAVKDFFK